MKTEAIREEEICKLLDNVDDDLICEILDSENVKDITGVSKAAHGGILVIEYEESR